MTASAEEARRLREAGTKGPWAWFVNPFKKDQGHVSPMAPNHPPLATRLKGEDAKLIAAAVNNFVPMAERVEELEVELSDVYDACRLSNKARDHWREKYESTQKAAGLAGNVSVARNREDWLSVREAPVINLEPRCFAYADRLACSFTNQSKMSAKGCAVGIVHGDSEASKVVSQTACTGTLEPQETKNVEVFWQIGEPKDICSTRNEALGIEQLDWSKCTFEVKPAHL